MRRAELALDRVGAAVAGVRRDHPGLNDMEVLDVAAGRLYRTQLERVAFDCPDATARSRELTLEGRWHAYGFAAAFDELRQQLLHTTSE